MKSKAGFTLAELILSVFIFSFIAASLATIVSTTNRHMFQNYRRNVLKTNVLLSMRRVQNNLSVATRIDLPREGDLGTSLAFAVNVDQTTGCYPISAADPVSWHYFCLANGSRLYYHTALITGSAVACGKPAPSIWCANDPVGKGCYAVLSCGGVGGTLLMEHVSPFLSGALFSRRPLEGINEVDTVRVALRSLWSASASGFGASQRDINSTLDTVIRLNRSK